MSEITKVITRERYSQGFTYEDFLNQPGVERLPLTESMTAFTLGTADAQFFKDVVRSMPLKVIAIVGDNGGGKDVHRALPLMAQIARASGMDMRVFPRDKNPDIMDLYLNQGKFRSIPVFAFFDEDLNPLCHWIEQPRAAVEFKDRVKRDLPDGSLPEKELRDTRNALYRPMWDAWRLEQVRELKELLSGIRPGHQDSSQKERPAGSNGRPLEEK